MDAGAVATQINGRPVFALPGEFPFYRALTFGDRGPDVDQLQRGLMAAGLLWGHDGIFGAPTERAVQKLYERASSDAPVEKRAATDPTASAHAVVQPADLLVVDQLPATVIAAPAVGTVASSESKFTLERGSTHAVADISPSSAAGLTVDTAGTAKVANTSMKVRVATIGDTPGTDETRRVTVTGVEADIPSELVGQELVADLDVHVAARDALIVPSSAVVPGGNNSAYVLVQRRQALHRVPVEELGTLDGRSAVKPLRGHRLRADDHVQIR